MDRRHYLAGLATLASGGLAGCAVGAPGGTSGSVGADVSAGNGSASGGTPTDSERPLGRSGFPADICTEPPQRDPGVYAITEPAFASDWRGRRLRSSYVGGEHDGAVERRPGGLPAESTVIGLDRGSGSRAYPITVLWTHEVVNDSLGGTPLLVTYCSLCRSAMVARRRLDGQVTTFRATGLLWAAPRLQEAMAEADGRVVGAERTGGERRSVRHAGNVVLVDGATGSYWSQILARAICGPKDGTVLDQVPTAVTTWGAWQASHPDTEVLLPPPYSGTTNPAR